MKTTLHKTATYVLDNRRKLAWKFALLLMALNIVSFAVYFACIGHAFLTLED